MKDLTEYAIALGYTGTKRVIVVDGKVVSYRNKDWIEFCEDLREEQKKQLDNEK